ncbi:hypothetical protein Tco_0366066 [Tanacetum coccineum]
MISMMLRLVFPPWQGVTPRSSSFLQNQLPPKEQDPGSFILPCSIGRLNFNNALADLGASISIMPLFMYKCLGIGKLEPINMMIEMADNTKCTPKGLVENLLVKIDKIIFPVDFFILDIVEDIRMPIILGRPLLATAHAKRGEEKRKKRLDHLKQDQTMSEIKQLGGEDCGFDSNEEEVVPKVDDVSLVDGVFEGTFGGDGEEDVVMGESVVLASSSLEMLAKSCLGGMVVSLIFMEGLEEEA